MLKIKSDEINNAHDLKTSLLEPKEEISPLELLEAAKSLSQYWVKNEFQERDNANVKNFTSIRTCLLE